MRKVTKKSQQPEMTFHTDPPTPIPPLPPPPPSPTLLVRERNGAHVHHHVLETPVVFLGFLSEFVPAVCRVQTVSRRGASAVCANQGVFICEATCSTQLVLLRMSHRQTTYVRGGLRMSSWRRMFEGAAERCRALHSCTDFLSHCFPTGDIRRRGKL